MLTRRGPLLLIAVTVVLVVVGVFLGVANAHRDSATGTPAAQATTRDNRTLIDAVTKLDPGVVDAVGNGGLPSTFVPIKDATPLAGSSGRPEILYVGAEYCPYCAAQRWAMVVALSRFGSFQHLYLTQSSSSDAYPNTSTFTFNRSTYTSQYVDFVAVETADRAGQPLQVPSDEQKALLARYDAPPYVAAAASGGIPWLDVANRYVMSSSGFTPAVLANLSWADIAGRLANAGDPVTKSIVGDAGNITAAICKATGGQPVAVCGSAAIAPLVVALH